MSQWAPQKKPVNLTAFPQFFLRNSLVFNALLGLGSLRPLDPSAHRSTFIVPISQFGSLLLILQVQGDRY